jgi:cytochrome c553
MMTPIEHLSRQRGVSGFPLLLSALIIGAAVAAASSRATAQSTSARPGEDFRALFATTADVADGKAIAEASCAGCHGLNGISTIAGVPHLAGQRAAYLHIELKAYQSGARGDSAMRNAVKFLNDDAFVKVAAYFASLDPAAPSPINAAAAPAADPVEAGKNAAVACTGCHGEAGISKIPGIPSMVGLDPKYLVVAMKAYKDGQRKDDMMKSMLANLSDADLENIALYYALQKPTRAQTPVAGDQAKGKAAAAACAGCHGEQGVSGAPANPSVAGQDAEYLAAALRAYKSGSRSDEAMKGQVASLDDNSMRDIAAYYANRQPQQPNVRKPLTAAEWAQRCDRCHGVNGNSVDPRMPALAGQRADYIDKVLNAYKTRARKSPEMVAMSDVLSDDEIKSLAAHYASQKARAVVFVTLPASVK